MRIVVIDDHLPWRELLRTIFVEELGCEWAGEAADGAAAVDIILETKPELVLLDLQLPKFGGFEVIDLVRKAIPESNRPPRYIVFSGNIGAYAIYRARNVGVHGLMDKTSCGLSIFRQALTAVAEGGVYFSRTITHSSAKLAVDPEAFYKILTNSELRILPLVADRMTDSEISRRLNISDDSVKKHMGNMFRKLGIHSRLALERYAAERGFSQFLSS